MLYEVITFWQVGGEPYTEADGDVRVSGMNMDNHVLKTSIGNPTYPAVATITEVKSAAYLGRLVTLNDVQFTDEMYGLTWADSVNATTRNAFSCVATARSTTGR